MLKARDFLGGFQFVPSSSLSNIILQTDLNLMKVFFLVFAWWDLMKTTHSEMHLDLHLESHFFLCLCNWVQFLYFNREVKWLLNGLYFLLLWQNLWQKKLKVKCVFELRVWGSGPSWWEVTAAEKRWMLALT